jgi:hypothetical protein
MINFFIEEVLLIRNFFSAIERGKKKVSKTLIETEATILNFGKT